ncbi:tRNA 2-selenouridine(34) synthase MnmH [Vogesella sp. LYT5W]|uniref:tRNA 2-selenouridine(34) synthase MnmH n=1 Tax=Vogesella margarita TaxID=2984199 RepID=A0ABT5IUY4_9NEIS|nr:tRNA 2-selenouridine(34) synthase MnmH [Vogesella margarita]MDC7715414.1 tRNA 2-selenouridine(34) synthase MnmH [Vogesella margarita]
MFFKLATVAQRHQFDEIIDVRTPAEFAEDHIPGAINCPVMSDEERVRVGTLYKQVSPFEARKVGAAIAARNIARHLDEQFARHPKSWRPLVYCWRGGQRSGSMAIILAQIGWAAHQLEGGYKAYRHQVLADLATLPQQFRFRVISGPTGSGKSRLLAALAAQGAQVLDLEGLAAHRGSVLGRLPDVTQPSQKRFDSLLDVALQAFDPTRPVFVEAESKKIGFVSLPDALYSRMHDSECLQLEVPLAARVEFLKRDYDFYLSEPERLVTQLGFLRNVHGKAQLEAWAALARGGDFDTLVGELLTGHYDPLYLRSQGKHYTQAVQPLAVPALDDATLQQVASQLAG